MRTTTREYWDTLDRIVRNQDRIIDELKARISRLEHELAITNSTTPMFRMLEQSDPGYRGSKVIKQILDKLGLRFVDDGELVEVTKSEA